MKTKLRFSTICIFILVLLNGIPTYSSDNPIEGPGIITIDLVDAQTDTHIIDIINGPIESGKILPWDKVDNKEVNIRANVTGDPALQIYVVFELSGPLNRTWTEKFAPYALFGDIDGDFLGVIMPPGKYYLKATAFDNSDAYLNDLETHFVVPDANEILGFEMITAEDNPVSGIQLIRDPLSYDAFLQAGLIPHLQYPKTFVAFVNEGFTGSVEMSIEGPPAWGSATRIENFGPYSMFGDQVHLPGADPNGYDFRHLPNGEYLITATPYALPDGKGGSGLPVSLKVTLRHIHPFFFEYQSEENGLLTPFVRIQDGFTYFQNLTGDFKGNTSIKATPLPFATFNSIELTIQGPINHTRIENYAPYTLFGDVDDVFNTLEFPAGTYMLSATPFSESNGMGDRGLTQHLSFTVFEGNYILNGAELGNVESGTFLDELLSADDGNTTFRSLVDNATVILRYDCINGPCPGSVVMALSGPVTSSRIENELPFTLFGDQGGNFTGRSLPIGDYTLSFTPYTQDGGMGVAGSTITADFSIVPDSNIPFVWSDTYSGPYNPFEVIEDGKTYFPTGGFNGVNSILALTYGGSVVLEISGPINHTQTENSDPYSLFGGVDFDFNTREFPDGAYTLTSTTYSEANGQGVAGVSSTITFKIERYFGTNLILLVDADTGNEIDNLYYSDDENGIDIHETPSNNASILVEYEQCDLNCPGSVLLELDGPITASRIENERPFTIFGGIYGALNGRNFPIGNYTIAVTAFSGPNGTGTVSETQIRDFEIIDSGSTLLKTALYPNPARTTTHVKTEEASSGLKTVIFDLAGNQVKELTNTKNSEQTIDVSELRPGIYIVQIQNGKERITKKLVVQ